MSPVSPAKLAQASLVGLSNLMRATDSPRGGVAVPGRHVIDLNSTPTHLPTSGHPETVGINGLTKGTPGAFPHPLKLYTTFLCRLLGICDTPVEQPDSQGNPQYPSPPDQYKKPCHEENYDCESPPPIQHQKPCHEDNYDCEAPPPEQYQKPCQEDNYDCEDSSYHDDEGYDDCENDCEDFYKKPPPGTFPPMPSFPDDGSSDETGPGKIRPDLGDWNRDWEDYEGHIGDLEGFPGESSPDENSHYGHGTKPCCQEKPHCCVGKYKEPEYDDKDGSDCEDAGEDDAQQSVGRWDDSESDDGGVGGDDGPESEDDEDDDEDGEEDGEDGEDDDEDGEDDGEGGEDDGEDDDEDDD